LKQPQNAGALFVSKLGGPEIVYNITIGAPVEFFVFEATSSNFESAGSCFKKKICYKSPGPVHRLNYYHLSNSNVRQNPAILSVVEIIIS
jgi:hypothetical protein